MVSNTFIVLSRNFKYNSILPCQNPELKKCDRQVSFFNVSTTAGLFLNLKLIFRGSLLKQREDHDKKILQLYVQTTACGASQAPKELML